MKPAPFTYCSPGTLDEALALLAEHGGEAKPLAGGQSLIPAMNFRLARPAVLVDLNGIAELAYVRPQSGGVVIGAMTRQRAVERNDTVRGAAPLLAETLPSIAHPQIRNRGTVGGNLGTASPAGDALPPLLVEEAEVELASAGGVRTMPLTDFLVGPKRNALGADELITAVRVAPSRASQTFMKVGPRNAMVIAVCSLAVVADRERGELRASFGSAGPVPGLVRCPIEDAKELPERVEAAASPIDDVRGTAAYRRHALRVLAGRALERCLA